MEKILNELILSASLLLSPGTPVDSIQYMLSDSDNYKTWTKQMGISSNLSGVLGRTYCGQDNSGNGACFVVFNTCLVEKNTKKRRRLLKETVYHEMAHVEDFFRNGDIHGHKKPWRKIMKEWGLKANAKSISSLPSCWDK